MRGNTFQKKNYNNSTTDPHCLTTTFVVQTAVEMVLYWWKSQPTHFFCLFWYANLRKSNQNKCFGHTGMLRVCYNYLECEASAQPVFCDLLVQYSQVVIHFETVKQAKFKWETVKSDFIKENQPVNSSVAMFVQFWLDDLFFNNEKIPEAGL